MKIKSEFYDYWEDYAKKHPEVANIKNAKIISQYDDEMYRFILGLFV